MKDKIIVVTGSTSGIGFGIASKFAKNGATLVINGLASDSEVKKLSSELILAQQRCYLIVPIFQNLQKLTGCLKI